MELNLKNTTLVNINKLFNRRSDAIKSMDDYSSMILKAKRKEAEEESKQEPAKAN